MFRLLVLVVVASLADNSYAQQAYQTSATTYHNNYRANHGSPALVLDNNLDNLAVQCAQYYAAQQTIDHTCPYKADNGENLVGGQGVWSPDDFAQLGTDSWYNEGTSYDYSNPGFTMSTGHFTQLVWKSSASFGFGVATVKGYTAGVGLYSPAGNMEGEFRQNVLPTQ